MSSIEDPVTLNVGIEFYKNRCLNRFVKGGDHYELALRQQEPVPVRVSCVMNPWMKAYVFPRDDPYFAVTDESGNFEIMDVPVGIREFRVLHEGRGLLGPEFPRGRLTVQVEPGVNDVGTKNVSLDFAP